MGGPRTAVRETPGPHWAVFLSSNAHDALWHLSDRAFRAFVTLACHSPRYGRPGYVDWGEFSTLPPSVRWELLSSLVDPLTGRLRFVKDRASRLDKRPGIPVALRTAVYERDEYACVECGATERLSLDHIHPYSRGGEDTIDNLRTLCMPCNLAKGARI